MKRNNVLVILLSIILPVGVGVFISIDSITSSLITSIISCVLLLSVSFLINAYFVDKKTNVYAPFMPITLSLMGISGFLAMIFFIVDNIPFINVSMNLLILFTVSFFILFSVFNLFWAMSIYHQYSKPGNKYNFKPEKLWIAIFGKTKIKESPLNFLIIHTPSILDKLEIFESSIKKQNFNDWKITTTKFNCQDHKNFEENKKQKQELEYILFPERLEYKSLDKEKNLITQPVSGIIILYTDETLNNTLELVAKWAKSHISQPIFYVNYSKQKFPYGFKNIQHEDNCLKNAWLDMLIYGMQRGEASGVVVKSKRVYLVMLFWVLLSLLIFSIAIFSIMRHENIEKNNVLQNENKEHIKALNSYQEHFTYVEYAEIFEGKNFYNQAARNCLFKLIGKNEIPSGISVAFWEIKGNEISNLGMASNTPDVKPFKMDTISIISSSFKNSGYFIIWERPHGNKEYTGKDTIYYYNIGLKGKEKSVKMERDENGNLKVYKIGNDSSFFEAKFNNRGDRSVGKDYILNYSIEREGYPQICVGIEIYGDYENSPDFLYTLKTRTILWEAVNQIMMYKAMFREKDIE